jgi:RimJ/RimL family protein N-acetyltransferase
VRLEPLAPAHDEGLWEASRAPEIWTWVQTPPDREGLQAILEEARAGTARREEFAFATIDVRSGRPVGSTRYLALRPADRGLEIGSTWLAPAMWRTGANVEAKLLQLQYAFETLGCLRVELKTHAANARSRGAMERLGATFEGVHRKHRILPGLGVRDTAWYSVIDDEWPQVRAGLHARLARLGTDAVGSAT